MASGQSSRERDPSLQTRQALRHGAIVELMRRFPPSLSIETACVTGVRLAAFGYAFGTLCAAPIVDGTRDGEYGDALAVQTVQTDFGDNASEWNAAYGRIENGRLFLMFTGNLQSNFNKLEVFIDSTSGGQSIFDSAGNDNAERMDGLAFDAGFTADYHVIARRGLSKFDLDFADLAAQTATFHENVFAGADAGTGSTGIGVNAGPIDVGYDGSNTAGISGGTGAADQDAARAVTTGLELSFSLADLDYTDGPINVMLGQNGDGHHFWSNQFLGGLEPPRGNLGGDEAGNFTGEGAINLQNFAGNQFFIVVPEPSATLFAGASLLVLSWTRRSRR